MMCMHRTADGKCLKFTVPPVISFCVDGPCPDEQLSNADRIRNMSDEELAAALMCPNEMGMDDIPCDNSDGKNCYKCLLDWLRQPAKEATHE